MSRAFDVGLVAQATALPGRLLCARGRALHESVRKPWHAVCVVRAPCAPLFSRPSHAAGVRPPTSGGDATAAMMASAVARHERASRSAHAATRGLDCCVRSMATARPIWLASSSSSEI